MTMRRLAPLLLVAVLLGGAAARWEVPASTASPRVAAVKNEALRDSGVAMSAATELPAPPAFIPPGSASAVSLAPDAAALLNEQLALQLLARDTALHLTPEQWAAFAAVTLNCQAVRQAYEASISKAAVLQRGVYRLEIPAYPAAGDALRAKFYAELRAQVGDAAAGEIAAQLGRSLEGRFAGFGVSVQTLDFAADPNGAEAEYQVTRTVKFWNSAEGSDRLTTRRETHFPGLEDPAGHTWGPFLAVLAARVTERIGG